MTADSPLRWNQILIGDWLERVRLKDDSVAFIKVSLERKKILVHGDKTEVEIKKNQINKERGYNVNMDSILVAQQIKSLLHYELAGSAMHKLKGKIKEDSFYNCQKKAHRDKRLQTDEKRLSLDHGSALCLLVSLLEASESPTISHYHVISKPFKSYQI